MPLRSFQRDRLNVQIHSSRLEMGAAGAAMAASVIRSTLEKEGRVAVIFASAPSQDEFLACLRSAPGIDWRRVVAFHLDEYAGIGADHPASFRRFLRERLIGHVPIGRFHELRGDAADLEAECSRYARLLAEERPVLVALGVGENGHLAFIDPPVCDFADPRDVRTVNLDPVCRMQQVHDGAFARLADVPARALSLTIPVFLRTPVAVVTVPGALKRKAVQAALEGEISERCPASILRRHGGAHLFLDSDAAALLTS